MTEQNQPSPSPCACGCRSQEKKAVSPWRFLPLAALLWIVAYANIEALSAALVGLLPIDQASHLAEALRFFFYDVPKVLLLLTAITFVMGIVHSYVTPEATRAFLSRAKLGPLSNVMAACIGIVTPFCSCSAIPLFIGMIQAGVPLGVTFSYLIAAPMINEVALALLFGLFGWKVAALYLGFGLLIAIVSGWIIGALRLEHLLEDWVRALAVNKSVVEAPRLSFAQRLPFGFDQTKQIVGKTWPYILVGIGVGAGIHGYVPQDALAALMGKEAWWSVPAAVLIGVPMYANAAGVLPVVQALLGKGAALGTALAFMMSVVALSLPEIIILRRVLKPKLIALFIGIVSLGIIAVGFLFNGVL